jgi:hypothetical protein
MIDLNIYNREVIFGSCSTLLVLGFASSPTMNGAIVHLANPFFLRNHISSFLHSIELVTNLLPSFDRK